MRLSFLILNYKTPNHLRLCIKNIKALDLGRLGISHEIIVVDNASNDGSAEMVQALYPDVRLIVSDSNVGHPAGNNIGLKEANGDYIAMVNPDIIFRNASDISKIVEVMDNDTKIAFLGPRLRNPDGSIQHSCYRQYSRFTPIYRRTFLGKLGFAKKDIERHLMTDFDHNSTQEVEWLLGACLFIRKTAIDQIGHMNSKLFLYFGDYEWCDRARQQCWKVLYFHGTEEIYHYHKRESASRRFSVAQAFSYVTRIHLKDWLTYLKLSKEYAKSA